MRHANTPVADAPGSPNQRAPRGTRVAKWVVIVSTYLAAFLYTLNSKGTVLITDPIQQDFNLDRYSSQWITGPEGVIGLVAVFSAIYFVQVYGVRLLFIAGSACLAVGALGTALAHQAWQEAIAGPVRSCAGLYALPGLTLMLRLYPRRQAIVFSIYLAMVYGGQVLSEPIGSLVAFHPTWRLLFFMIAIGGFWSFLGAVFLFPDDRPAVKPAHGFDWQGAMLLGVIMTLIFFLLYRGNYLGWLISTPICVAVVALAAAIALFTWRELTAPLPFIDLSAFLYRTVAITILCAAFWSAALYAVGMEVPHYLLLRGYENWRTGWVTLPMSLILFAAMIVGGFVRNRSALVWMLRGGLAGMTLLTLVIAGVDLYTSWQWIMVVTSAWGVCAGLCLPAIGRLAFEGQHPKEAASTGAMKFFLRAFGGTVGVLLAGVILDQAVAGGLEYVRTSMTLGQGTLETTTPVIQDYLVRHGSSPTAAAEQTETIVGYWVHLHAQVIGYRAALRFGAYLSAIGFVISLFISRKKEISVLDADL
ncbi:MAG: MFS transporter [Planctomycetes bacterium]|nr:MFS transporter [Planctomycetota bacterium]